MHSSAEQELPLNVLASRYGDSDDDEPAGCAKVQPGVNTLQPPPATDAPASEGPAAGGSGAGRQEAWSEGEEDWSEEEVEEWSEDEEYDEQRLASALAWADLREDQQARGNAGTGGTGGAALGGYRPNAQGGALNAPRGRGVGASGGKLAPTANNMGRLDSRFHAGAVRPLAPPAAAAAAAAGHDALAEALGDGRGLAPSTRISAAVANQVARAGSGRGGGGGKGGGSGGGRDRADRATVEQVLDPRTRMVLFKVRRRGERGQGGGGGVQLPLQAAPGARDAAALAPRHAPFLPPPQDAQPRPVFRGQRLRVHGQGGQCLPRLRA